MKLRNNPIKKSIELEVGLFSFPLRKGAGKFGLDLCKSYKSRKKQCK